MISNFFDVSYIWWRTVGEREETIRQRSKNLKFQPRVHQSSEKRSRASKSIFSRLNRLNSKMSMLSARLAASMARNLPRTAQQVRYFNQN